MGEANRRARYLLARLGVANQIQLHAWFHKLGWCIENRAGGRVEIENVFIVSIMSIMSIMSIVSIVSIVSIELTSRLGEVEHVRDGSGILLIGTRIGAGSRNDRTGQLPVRLDECDR